MRVLMLATDLERGGLPMRLARLATALHDTCVEPVVGCLAAKGPVSFELEAAGIETFSCDARGRYDISCLWSLARQVRRLDPDLIQSFLCHANVAARLVGRLDRYRPVVTGTVTIELERRTHRFLESLTCGLSDRHVANSRAVADHLRVDLGFPSERLVVIPNGISLEEFDGQPAIDRRAMGLAADVPLIVWAGRMDPVKNLETVVEVIARALGHMPLQAVLLGDGPERPRIESLIRKKGLSSAIRMALWSDRVLGWLKAADLLLFPSLTEGSPNVVLEAMACGCAVVASDVPACRELIDSGVHGWLCRSDDLEGLVAAVLLASSDTAARRRCADAARRRVEEGHAMQAIVHQWEMLFEQVVQGR
ncbi:MAG TPA: glycosyltransferase [Phycisphaerae bacterium]|nr:glycosyltransferase [Phycisphaerae bacterium]